MQVNLSSTNPPLNSLARYVPTPLTFSVHIIYPTFKSPLAFPILIFILFEASSSSKGKVAYHKLTSGLTKFSALLVSMAPTFLVEAVFQILVFEPSSICRLYNSSTDASTGVALVTFAYEKSAIPVSLQKVPPKIAKSSDWLLYMAWKLSYGRNS